LPALKTVPDPRHQRQLAWCPQSLYIKRYLARPLIARHGVVEECLRGFGLAFDLPDARVGQVVRLLPERGDEGGAKPLDAIIRLSREVAVVERN